MINPKSSNNKDVLNNFNLYLKRYDMNYELDNNFINAKNDDVLSEKELIDTIRSYTSRLDESTKNIEDLNKKNIEIKKILDMCEELMKTINSADVSFHKIINECNPTIFGMGLKAIDKNAEIKPVMEASCFDLIQRIIQELNIKLDENSSIIDKKSEILKNMKMVVRKTIDDNEIINKWKNASPSTCTICYEDKVSICINPCGHTLCKTCSEKVSNNCFTCRTKILSKIKMIIDFEESEENTNISAVDGTMTSNSVNISGLSSFSDFSVFAGGPGFFQEFTSN